MVLLDIKSINFIPNSGILDTIFHQSWLRISIFGSPKGGYFITLIGLIITLIIAYLASWVTEKLTSKKVGGLLAATLITIFGSILFQTYVNLPFDFLLEGVPVIAAVLGAIVVAVFYVLIRGKVQGGKSGGH